MGIGLEDLKVLKNAETTADAIWKEIAKWDHFAKEVVGKQLARAADSVGANIAESFGRFHYGEKLQFLYYARGSLYESKYWLNRALKRQLMQPEQVQNYASQLTDLARQLNAFAGSIKAQRKNKPRQANILAEAAVAYTTDVSDEIPDPLFTEEELQWLQTIPIE
jgi:four helix bundle protein